MVLLIQPDSTQYGFVNSGFGAHMGRTMMLQELRSLLAYCPADATEQTYKTAIIEDNVLLKTTQDARLRSYKWLKQLYALDPNVIIFRVLRDLWGQNQEAQPLLALLCAIARDATLRATVDLIISAKKNETLTAPQLQKAIDEAYPGQLAASTLASAGRNTLSSWDQAGFLQGAKEKTRQVVHPIPLVTAYALFLAYLNGERGDGLFLSAWCRLLDQPAHVLRAQAEQASQQGWLEYRFTGQVTEITFRHFLRDGQHE